MVLFVNACIRGDVSRTLSLCRTYLEGVKLAGEQVRSVNLDQVKPLPLSAQKVAYRSQLLRKGCLTDEMFNLAHQFAEADEIVIGAPYWDLTFPAALKAYIEQITVEGITFNFTPQATYDGLCKAKHLTYITTSGGPLTEPFFRSLNGNWEPTLIKPVPGQNLGYDMICALAKMYGISEVRYISAEGTDVEGINIDELLDKGREQIELLLRKDGRA